MTALSKLQLKQLWKAYFQPTSANFSDLIDSWADYNYTATGTSAVARPVISKLGDIVSVKDFGAVGDGVTDDTAAIQAAIDYIETLNGGKVEVPQGNFKVSSTLQINGGKGVQLIGQGADGNHDGGTGAAAATTLSWYGASSGTVINVSSPSGSGNSRQFGSAVCDIKIDCRGVAGIGLLVTSVFCCNFSRIFIISPIIAGVKTTTLGNANLAEASDTQRCVFDRISVRAVDGAATKAAHGIWLTSHNPSSSNSNTSLNLFTQCDVQQWGGAGSGYGLFLEDCDNNTFMNVRVFRAGGTTVECVRMVGNPSNDYNHFWNLSAGGVNGITIKGTASGFSVNPKGSSFWVTDVSNGTQYPTADTGVVFGWHWDWNLFTNQAFDKVAIGDGAFSALSARSAIGLYSLVVNNGSDSHIRLMQNADVWAISVVGANGDLRFTRVAGSGAVDVGAGAPVRVLGQLVSIGAPDSAGVGFRLLRVPN